MYKKDYFWPLVALCVVSLFLFLGQTFFNTRGEPREAVVALSMLQQGNWVLPVNNGVELAFKPPFFHWCIAAIYVRHCKDEEGRPLVDSQEYLIKKHTRRPVRH